MTNPSQPTAEPFPLYLLANDLQTSRANSASMPKAALGAALAAVGLVCGGMPRWLFLLIGGALLRRSFLGAPLHELRSPLDKREDGAATSLYPRERGERIEASVEIKRSPQTLYRFWQNLEELPRVLRHVKAVQRHGERGVTWKVKGPADEIFEWEAEIVSEDANRYIVWQSLPDAPGTSAGSVWFEPVGPEATRMHVGLDLHDGAKALGLVTTKGSADRAKAELLEDLTTFKAFSERELRELCRNR